MSLIEERESKEKDKKAKKYLHLSVKIIKTSFFRDRELAKIKIHKEDVELIVSYYDTMFTGICS